MFGRRAAVLLLCCVGAAWAAAPPPALTPDQIIWRRERAVLWRKAQAEWKAGERDAAVASMKAASALTERVYGAASMPVYFSASWLASWERQRSNAAEWAWQCRRKWKALATLHGEGDWRARDAYREWQDALVVGRSPPAHHEALRRVTSLVVRVEDACREGRHREALPWAKEALAIRTEILGEGHHGTVQSLNYLAYIHHATGAHAAALTMFRRALTLTEKSLGRDHPDYATALNNLATLLKDMGEAGEALPLSRQAVVLRGSLLGLRHPQYASSLSNHAVLLHEMGDFQAALPLARRALHIHEGAPGGVRADAAHVLNNLAALLKDMGDHKAALPLFKRSLALQEGVLGRRHPTCIGALNNLAVMHWSLGNREAALPLFTEAVKLSGEVLGRRHPNHASSVHLLGMLHKDMGEYKAALPLLKRAVELRIEVLGRKHFAFALSLHGLAELLHAAGDRDDALRLYKQALEVYAGSAGRMHPSYAGCLSDLAELHIDRGDTDAAQPLLEEALALREKTFGGAHPQLALSQYRLAVLHWIRGGRDKAHRLATLSVGSMDRYFREQLVAYGPRLAGDKVASAAGALDVLLSTRTDDASSAGLYAATQAYKGILATRAAEARLVSGDPKAAGLLADLQRASGRLAVHAGKMPDAAAALVPWRARLAELEEAKAEAAVSLARASESFRALAEPVTASGVAAALPAGAALVEYLVYTHYTPSGKGRAASAERRLLAWALRPGTAPALAALGPVAPIEADIARWHAALRAGGPTPEVGAALRKALWEPLARHIEGADLVVLSPDGEIATLPFAALPGKAPKSYLIEDHPLLHVTSGRQLVSRASTPGGAGLLALGVRDFGEPPAASSAARWPPLPGAALESRAAAAIFTAQLKAKARLPAGDKAALLAGLAERPAYLHLATHGYFAPPAAGAGPRPPVLLGGTSPDAARLFTRNPLLACGLVLAGANADPVNGVLSGEEVSGLDLTSVRLAVLSACQTAVGKQSGWQGVQGLQRAFQEAGARRLLASLWSVDDAATSVLMEEFYTNLWARGLPAYSALQKAQITVLKRPDLVVRKGRELADALKGEKGGGGAIRGFAAKGGGRVAWWAPWVISGEP